MVLAGILLGILLFLVAVRLLGAAASANLPTLEPILERIVASPASALGAGWLAAYVLVNGSAVAALGVSLHHAGALGSLRGLLVVLGSRLGAAGVVVLVGGLDYLAERRLDFVEATRLGMLTFVVTYAVLLPAVLVSLLLSGPWVRWFPASAPAGDPALPLFGPADALATTLLEIAGPGPTFLASLLLFVGSLRLLDRSLRSVEPRTIRRGVLRFLRRPGPAFLAGLVVTALATSVAFSVGLLVPLYNRRLLVRRMMIPYLLGANLGTFSDTLAVALVLGTPSTLGLVLLSIAATALATLPALLAWTRYDALVQDVYDAIQATRTRYLATLALLVVVPLALVLLG